MASRFSPDLCNIEGPERLTSSKFWTLTKLVGQGYCEVWLGVGASRVPSARLCGYVEWCLGIAKMSDRGTTLGDHNALQRRHHSINVAGGLSDSLGHLDHKPPSVYSHH